MLENCPIDNILIILGIVYCIAISLPTAGGRKKAAVNYGQGDSSGSDF